MLKKKKLQEFKKNQKNNNSQNVTEDRGTKKRWTAPAVERLSPSRSPRTKKAVEKEL